MKPEGFGPYVVPTRETVNAVALSVISHGGAVMEGVHRSQRIDYASDPDALTALRKNPVGDRWTCSCGQAGVSVELPPSAFPTDQYADGSRRPKDTTELCIRCDAVHLMPKFADA